MFQALWVSQRNSSLDCSLRVHLQLAIRTSEKEHFSVTDTGSLEENPGTCNRSRTYDLLVTSPDALLLSYRRLMGIKAIKLGSCDKHSADC